jgi:hypothetical protein
LRLREMMPPHIIWEADDLLLPANQNSVVHITPRLSLNAAP